MFNYYAEWGTKRIPVSEATYKLLMAHNWRHVVTCEGCIIIQPVRGLAQHVEN